MKKLMISAVCIFFAVAVNAQKNKLTSESPTTYATVENPHDPLVNGIPYSQYKSQVQAEEKKKAAREEEAKFQQKKMQEKILSTNNKSLQNEKAKEEK